MQRFLHDENLRRFRQLLAEESNPIKREQIKRLIKEEEARKINRPADGKADQ